MARIKKGDQVIVIAGRDKGKTGRVLRVLPDADRVVVETPTIEDLAVHIAKEAGRE